MPRLLFEKTGSAVWMSHLDLMRLMQRAFKRAGLPLTHTQGFNPRPSVSIALPLSVGVESVCELMDFDLEGELPPMGTIQTRLNAVLVPGVTVRQVYMDGRKIRDLALLRCRLGLEYDGGIPAGATDAIATLFARESLMVEKKSKNGIREQDIRPMIRELSVAQTGEKELRVEALITCQNPSLNPMQLYGAIVRYLPEAAPDFCTCRREELYDEKETIFR